VTLRPLLLTFHTAPLLLIAIFAPLIRLGVSGGLYGLPLLLIIGSWFFKYGFLLLDHAAEGRPGAPVLTAEAINPLGEMRPLAYALAAFGFYAITSVLGDVVGPNVLTVIRLLGLVALPAVMATQTVTGSLARALNPVAVVTMIVRLGWAYLLIIAVVVVAGLIGRAIVLEGDALAFILRIALLMWLWLAIFAFLGGVLHARRFEVGFEPEHSPERRQGREEKDLDRERDRFMDLVFAEYRAGGRGNPWTTIEERATRSPTPLTEYAWIYERVATWPNPKLADRVAQQLLPLLLAANRNGDALRVVKARIEANSEFRPVTGEQLVRLAELARDAGDRPLARALLINFDQHFPDDPARAGARRLTEQVTR